MEKKSEASSFGQRLSVVRNEVRNLSKERVSEICSIAEQTHSSPVSEETQERTGFSWDNVPSDYVPFDQLPWDKFSQFSNTFSKK